MVSNNGWNEHKLLIMHELKQMSAQLAKLREGHVQIKEQIAGLKVRASVWGALAGTIPFIVGIILWIIKSQI